MTAIGHWFWRLLIGNPIVLRIVQGGSRRLGHLWIRMAYLGVMTGLMVLGLLIAGGVTSTNLTDLAKAGTTLFAVVAYGQVVLVCLLAPLFMAGAIDQEHAGQTYDILLTTPLSNLQIVLGSLLGRLFFVWALVLSGLPLFSVLLLFGGVPVASVFVAFAVAGLTALLVGAVAVAISVSRIGGRKAVFVFVISVAAYMAALYVADQLVRRYTPAPTPGQPIASALGATRATTWLTPWHPILVLESHLNTANYRPRNPADMADYSWTSRQILGQPLATFTSVSLAISVILIFWSAWQVRRISLNEGQVSLGRRLLSMLGLARWTTQGQRRRSSRIVWANPIAWREAHTRGNQLASVLGRWGFLFIGLGLAVWFLYLYHHRLINPLTGTLTTADDLQGILASLLLIELVVIVMVALYMSAGSVSREREDGTLDLLLTTPVTPRQYIWGKLRGLVSFLALLLVTPMLTVAVLSLYATVGLMYHWPQALASYAIRNSGSPAQATFPLFLPEVCLLLPLMVVPFVAACVAIGMSASIKARGVLGAIVPSVAIVGLLALTLGFCGHAAAANIPLVGPAFNALSPATNILMLLNPWETIINFGSNPVMGRITLATSAVICACVYGLVVYTLIQTMVRSFDHTVRHLSGTTN